MQAIPATGLAQGIQYLEEINSPLLKRGKDGEAPVVVCSLGDASVTEGEVSEAWQFAVLKGLPIVYLVQDNEWGISAMASGNPLVWMHSNMPKALKGLIKSVWTEPIFSRVTIRSAKW
jgi:TPP-dependent pyruvate/acetoin dehydrogenase alpha subunit